MYLDCGYLIKYFVLVCVGLWKKYAGLNVGIIIKQKIYAAKLIFEPYFFS